METQLKLQLSPYWGNFLQLLLKVHYTGVTNQDVVAAAINWYTVFRVDGVYASLPGELSQMLIPTVKLSKLASSLEDASSGALESLRIVQLSLERFICSAVWANPELPFGVHPLPRSVVRTSGCIDYKRILSEETAVYLRNHPAVLPNARWYSILVEQEEYKVLLQLSEGYKITPESALQVLLEALLYQFKLNPHLRTDSFVGDALTASYNLRHQGLRLEGALLTLRASLLRLSYLGDILDQKGPLLRLGALPGQSINDLTGFTPDRESIGYFSKGGEDEGDIVLDSTVLHHL